MNQYGKLVCRLCVHIHDTNIPAQILGGNIPVRKKATTESPISFTEPIALPDTALNFLNLTFTNSMWQKGLTKHNVDYQCIMLAIRNISTKQPIWCPRKLKMRTELILNLEEWELRTAAPGCSSAAAETYTPSGYPSSWSFDYDTTRAVIGCCRHLKYCYLLWAYTTGW